MTRIEIDGLQLNVNRAGSGPPVVLLHGFTGSAIGWDPLIRLLAPEFTTLAVDIVGHGESDAPSDIERYRMSRCVDDLSELIEALLKELGYRRACWLGYSMGGRVALQVAVRHPQLVSGLVLEGATPGIQSENDRSRRIADDREMANRIERHGVEAFVNEWESLPLFATQLKLEPEVRAAVRSGRIANRAVGLANSLRGKGTGAQESVHDRLGSVRIPVLIIAGELDDKFSKIGREMKGALPDATMQLIEGAGHAAHIERPQNFGDVVAGFLRKINHTMSRDQFSVVRAPENEQRSRRIK